MDNNRSNPENFALNQLAKVIIRWGWKAALVLMGFTLLVTGVVFLFLPGPGLAIIAAGLTLLAVEFIWARRLLNKMKKQGNKALKAMKINFLNN